jgi:hypothetical protein
MSPVPIGKVRGPASKVPWPPIVDQDVILKAARGTEVPTDVPVANTFHPGTQLVESGCGEGQIGPALRFRQLLHGQHNPVNLFACPVQFGRKQPQGCRTKK